MNLTPPELTTVETKIIRENMDTWDFYNKRATESSNPNLSDALLLEASKSSHRVCEIIQRVFLKE